MEGERSFGGSLKWIIEEGIEVDFWARGRIWMDGWMDCWISQLAGAGLG